MVVVLTFTFVLPLAVVSAQGSSPVGPGGSASYLPGPPGMPTLASFEETLRPWLARSGGYGVIPYATEPVEKDTYLYISVLGDVNGDGHDDLLYSLRDAKDVGSIEVRSGADLAQVLWALEIGESYGYQTDDLDGDGIRDVAFNEWGESTPTGAGAGGIVVGSGYEYTYETHFLSGMTGEEIVTTTGKSAFAMTGAFLLASVRAYTFSYVWAAVAGTQTIAQIAPTDNYKSTTACALLACVYANQRDTDVTVTFIDDKGATRGTIQRVDDLANVQSYLVADVTADGLPDAIITELQAPSVYVQGNDVPVSKAAISLFGTDGAELWSIVGDPALNLYTYALPIGDLDGDVKQEIAYLVVSLTDPSNFHARLVVLSGATGSELSVLEEDNTASFLLPFGPGANGKGEALLLAGAFMGGSDAGFRVSPVGADLQPRWTADIGMAEPLNIDFSSFELNGFNDWTGDALPDLALAERGGNYPSYAYAVQLLDGASGKTTWEANYEDALHLAVLPDLTGIGSGDIAISQQTGAMPNDFRGATVAFTAFAAEDGGALFRQVLRQPTGPAGVEGGLNLTVRGVGDVTGDGLPDLAVRLEEATPPAEVHEVGSFTYTTSGGPGNVTWYILASDSGEAAPVSAEPSTGDGTGPGGDELPPAEDLSNGRPLPSAARPESAGDGPSTPGLALPIILAFVALGAWTARRRSW